MTKIWRNAIHEIGKEKLLRMNRERSNFLCSVRLLDKWKKECLGKIRNFFNSTSKLVANLGFPQANNINKTMIRRGFCFVSVFWVTKHEIKRKRKSGETYEDIYQDRNLEQWVRGRWGKDWSPLKKTKKKCCCGSTPLAASSCFLFKGAVYRWWHCFFYREVFHIYI